MLEISNHNQTRFVEKHNRLQSTFAHQMNKQTTCVKTQHAGYPLVCSAQTVQCNALFPVGKLNGFAIGFHMNSWNSLQLLLGQLASNTCWWSGCCNIWSKCKQTVWSTYFNSSMGGMCQKLQIVLYCWHVNHFVAWHYRYEGVTRYFQTSSTDVLLYCCNVFVWSWNRMLQPTSPSPAVKKNTLILQRLRQVL